MLILPLAVLLSCGLAFGGAPCNPGVCRRRSVAKCLDLECVVINFFYVETWLQALL